VKTLVLQGPFLTRKQAARALGVDRDQIRGRPDLLRVTGLLEECYFEFQCQSDRLMKDVGRVVLAMRGQLTDIEIADWMVRQNSDLREMTPLAWIQHGLGMHTAIRVATASASRS
jgi:hypothetical protein